MEDFPCISWEEFTELLQAMECNAAASDPMTFGGVQLLKRFFKSASELITAAWSEINWQGKVWPIPAERMKDKGESRKEHFVP